MFWSGEKNIYFAHSGRKLFENGIKNNQDLWSLLLLASRFDQKK